MAVHFFGGNFFGGDYFESSPLPVIDTHDGGDRKRYDEKRRESAARRRQQLTDAFTPPIAARDGAAQVSLGLASGAAPGQPQIERFDFDADDEEIILLI